MTTAQKPGAGQDIKNRLKVKGAKTLKSGWRGYVYNPRHDWIFKKFACTEKTALYSFPVNLKTCLRVRLRYYPEVKEFPV